MTRTRTTVVVLGLTLLLLCAGLALWFLVLEPAEEDDAAAGLADAVEPVMGRLGAVADRVNLLLGSRADAVAASLQAQVPAETPARSDFIGACLAMWRNESGFRPDIFNYYLRDEDGQKVLGATGKPILKQAFGYDDPNYKYAHACGIAQIVYLQDAGLTKANALDLDANVGASLRRLNLPAWSKIMDGIPSADLQTRAACLYMGHGRGPATVPLAVSTIAAGGDWAEVSAAVGARYGTGGLRFAHMWSCAANARHYADKYGSPA